MKQLSIPVIWKKLLLEERIVVTSEEIYELARRVGKDPQRSLKYLEYHGYVQRIFRGVYYVKYPEEIELGSCEHSVYEIIAMGLSVKGVSRWYFGLETGLKMNGMTHEFFTMDFVITDSYFTTKPIEIFGCKVRFLKWVPVYQSFGVLKKRGIRYSDPEKSVLDLMYRRYRKRYGKGQYRYLLEEYGDHLDRGTLEGYLAYYPRSFQKDIR